MSVKKAIEIRTRKPRFEALTGRPKNEFSIESHGIVNAGNDGKFSGFAQLLLVLNLNAEQHGELSSRAAVSLSLTELAEKTNLSIASVQAQLSELVSRCGNDDPEWVKAHGKCPKGECRCPKMLTVSKAGNVNAYSLNLANFPLAPRYVAPKLAEVPKPAAAAPLEAPVRLVKGKAARLPFVPSEYEGVLVLAHDDLDLDVFLTIRGRQVIANIRRAVAELAKVTPARKGETKAKPEEPKRVSDFRASVSALLDEEWDEAFTPAFFARVLAASGDEVPAEAFAVRARADLDLAKNRVKGRTKHAPQILIRYAKEARMKWEQDTEKRAVAEARKPKPPTAEEIAALEARVRGAS